MRVLTGEQVLIRIFVGDGDKWHHMPLYRALLERLRKEGFAGATVFHGIAGFGASSVIHAAHLLDLSGDLPVLIEVVEDEIYASKLMSILDEMITGGALITTEKVNVQKYIVGEHRHQSTAP